MTSPSVGNIAPTSVPTAADSHTVNLPTGIVSGSVVIIAGRVAEPATSVWPSGWQTYLSDGTNTWHDLDLDGSDDTTTIIVRKCDGTEGSTIAVSHSGNTCKAAYVAIRLSGAEDPGSVMPDILSAVGLDANPDAPSESVTGGPKDVLSIALDTHEGEQTSTVTYPSGYINTAQVTSGTGGSIATNCQINYGTRELTNVSSENPSAFTIDTLDNWTAITILVHPASAASPQNLTGAVFTKAPTFPTGTLSATYGLTGAVFTKAGTYPAGQIAATYALTGTTFQRAPTFATGVVSQPGGGTQALTGAVFTSAPAFATGTVSSTYALTGSAFTRAPTFGAGTLSATYALTGTAFTKAPTFPTGSIALVGADPANLQVVINGTTAELSWTASPTGGVVDYSIFRRSPQTGAPFDPEVDTPIATGITATTYNDQNLGAGEYDWQVFGRIPG